MGASCIITPKARNGKPSRLFADTYRHTYDREVSKTVWGVNTLGEVRTYLTKTSSE